MIIWPIFSSSVIRASKPATRASTADVSGWAAASLPASSASATVASTSATAPASGGCCPSFCDATGATVGLVPPDPPQATAWPTKAPSARPRAVRPAGRWTPCTRYSSREAGRAAHRMAEPAPRGIALRHSRDPSQNGVPDPPPQGLSALARHRAEAHDACAHPLLDRVERRLASSGTEFVDLRCDEDRLQGPCLAHGPSLAQKRGELALLVLGSSPDVHEDDDGTKAGPVAQVALDHPLPLASLGLRAA